MLFLSCDQDQPEITVTLINNEEYFEPRITIEGTDTGHVKFTVQIEGKDGNAVTGARVTARDMINRTQVLKFSSENYCYTGTMLDLKDVTLYTIEIDSALIKKQLSINGPYVQFNIAPALTVLRDETGASALSGDYLDGSKPIQIAWNSCGIDVVYHVLIRTPLVSHFSITTEDLTVTLPGNTINAGSYFISITAQKIYGDPLFKEFNYCSISSISSMETGLGVY